VRRAGGAAALATAVLLATAETSSAATFRVTRATDDGPGSLREAISAANREPGSTIVVSLPSGDPIVLATQLPSLRAAGTTLDGGGGTLREGEGCTRPAGRQGCDGIVVVGPGVTVRRLRVSGFTFDGVAVRGNEAADVRIEDVEAIGNRDDGIGVSDGAGPVVVERCLLMDNGFRTKGKGLLAFGSGEVSVRGCLVVGNRDGITATRGSRVILEDVLVAGNYDKGVGVSDADVRGRDVRIFASGRRPDGPGAAPNGDGLRVGVHGSAELEDSAIEGSSDGGVVVLDTSRVVLKRCRVANNRGGNLSVAPEARLERDGALVSANGGRPRARPSLAVREDSSPPSPPVRPPGAAR
jgi:hypothetical protein